MASVVLYCIADCKGCSIRPKQAHAVRGIQFQLQRSHKQFYQRGIVSALSLELRSLLISSNVISVQPAKLASCTVQPADVLSTLKIDTFYHDLF